MHAGFKICWGSGCMNNAVSYCRGAKVQQSAAQDGRAGYTAPSPNAAHFTGKWSLIARGRESYSYIWKYQDKVIGWRRGAKTRFMISGLPSVFGLITWRGICCSVNEARQRIYSFGHNVLFWNMYGTCSVHCIQSCRTWIQSFLGKNIA